MADKSSNQQQPHKTFWQRRGHWLLFLTIGILIVALTIGWQAIYQQRNGMVVGRPLASSHNHLHTVVFSSRPGVVYLGTHFGLFTSTDNGRTWPQQQGALSTAMITAVAVSPTNPDLLAVLAVPTNGITQPAGMYVSADAGQHWHFTIPSGLSASAYPLSLQGALGANGHFYVFFAGMGWFETRDLGQHWSVLILGELATSQRSVLLPDPHAHAHLLLGVDQGLFESWDDGQRWQQIIAVPGAVLALVAMQPAADQERVLLCATEQGLYRGQEQRGRIIWSQLSVPAVGSVTRLALNSDDSVLYALFGSDLWFSADQGRTWQRRWHFTRSDLIALVIDPQHPQEVLAGFFWPGLVMVSTDRGSSWRTLTS